MKYWMPFIGKPMSKLLLLQPADSRPRLLATLTEAGIAFCQHSFIDIEPVPDIVADLSDADAVIWVSKNAVYFANQARVLLPEDVRMYAVGPGTAKRACIAFNRPCQCPATVHSSESLLHFSELQQLTGQHWYIVKGVGGRELLADSLRARGASVTSLIVYERRKKPLNNPGIVQDWMQHVDKIAVSSAEQLSYFLSELPQQAETWLRHCHWIVPSARLAALIPFATNNTITITQSASENAMIRALTDHGNDYDRRK